MARGGIAYPMDIRGFVYYRQLGRWLLFLCLCPLVTPLCFSQTAAQGGKAAVDLEKFETAKETNDRISQLALTASVEQGDYTIGGGDLLAIEVFDVPELSRDVRVNESGFVSLP